MKTTSVCKRIKEDAAFSTQYNQTLYWLKSRFGVANHCENPNCKQVCTSKKFRWKLLDGCLYEKKRENFVQLCNKCYHASFRKPHHAIGTRIYGMWQNMLNRCRNHNVESHKYYGGKGITVCQEWEEFENFYNDMIDGYADNLSLDRKENDKGYYKENCRWVTMKVQQSNRTNNFWIEYNGAKKILLDWAREIPIDQAKLSLYIKEGYSIGDVKSYILNRNYKSESIKQVLKRIL